MSFDEQVVQVGDLGRFSMRAIYDALATSAQSNTSALPPRRTRQEDAEDSDCSWTQDDDNGTFYFDMQRRLKSFAVSEGPSTMTTAFLSKSQRRFVHATAQILRLGHASLGPAGRLRQMVVFKESGPAPSMIPTSDASQNLPIACSTTADTSASKKRRRLERIENGFPCHYCDKLYDRASERTKHEQAHQPNLTSRFSCPVCGKGFRYPKDLRRHSKVHERATGSAPLSLPSSFGSVPLSSTLTTDSRVPSDMSLTFSSNAASKDVSPVLGARNGVQIPGLELDPLMLDDSAWKAAADDWLYDPSIGFGSVEDEDFLEMANFRKQ